MKKFRSLFPEEVEVRVASVYDKGASLIVYKDARVDMNLLDEYFPNNWEDSYERKGETLFCSLTLYTENGPRTYTDCGTPSNAEAEKGEVSSAFKRASTKAGIGRGLYTAPFIWVNASSLRTKDNSVPRNKEEVKEALNNARLRVSDIVFAESRAGEYIDYLEIVDEKTGEVLYTYSDRNRDAISSVSDELSEIRSLMAKIPTARKEQLCKTNGSENFSEFLCKTYKVANLNGIADSTKLYATCKATLEAEVKMASAKRDAAVKAAVSKPKEATEKDVKPASMTAPRKKVSEDPLSAYIDAINETPETEASDAAPETGASTSTSPEDVLFECSDDAPENVLSLRGMRIGDIPANFIKEFARKNARVRVHVAQNSLDAIEAVKAAM
jgi:hypothetical protein